MARIIAISSQVVCGHVGLSIMVPALHALGHEVIAFPTVVLSNHPGHAYVSGTKLDPGVLHAMLEALDANGWLTGIDALVTGYLPTVGHVRFAAAARTLLRDRSPGLFHLCDPVMGDDPKGLYIDRAAADAVRDELLPSSDLATPNRFEMSYLSGRDVRSPADAITAAARFDCRAVLTTSVPAEPPGRLLEADSGAVDLANVLYAERIAVATRVARRPAAPHGTGDLMAALMIGHLLAPGDGHEPSQVSSHRPDLLRALALATAGVDRALVSADGPPAKGREHAIPVDAVRAAAARDIGWPICPVEPPKTASIALDPATP